MKNNAPAHSKVQELRNAKEDLLPAGMSNKALVWRKPETVRGFTTSFPTR